MLFILGAVNHVKAAQCGDVEYFLQKIYKLWNEQRSKAYHTSRCSTQANALDRRKIRHL